MKCSVEFSNPKIRVPNHKKRKQYLYNYYAGFSDHFVKDVLSAYSLDQTSVVLDPWNGSGTTTKIAYQNGFQAIGFDVNPVMVIVAKANLLDLHTVSGSLNTIPFS